ncbi:MAG TPA: Flp pilus assembly protein CpaB [Alphaproteobacteria bacterium]|nr:Flp pilus assembly protein CpaB [Alphaproteobacteria bacterium]HAJ47014.1 Flp pilus assembly protein CpaB [Alphaproteobacteria bacterium]
MNTTRVMIFVAALGAAAMAAFLARGFLGSKEPKAAAANLETTEVLVAARSIAAGSRIGLADLKWKPWPKDGIDPAYVTKAAQPNAIDESAAGSVARAPVMAGEPITGQKVVKADGAGFLAAVLSPGYRAYAVKLNAERGAGGFILPNDRVDVIMTRRMGTDDGGRPAFDGATVLRDVRVLAIDQVSKEEEGNQAIVGKTATLELLPNQAETLALAEAMGDIMLSLRSLVQEGDKNQTAQNADAESIFGPKQRNSLQVYRYGIRATNAEVQGQ